MAEFPPIYILSLPGSNRLPSLTGDLDSWKIPYEVVWGIDGREKLPEEFEHLIDREAAQRRLGRPMSDGEFACALSHKKIYEKIANNPDVSAIVLEDDACLSSNFFKLGPSLLSAPCGLLLFDHKNTYVHRKDRIIFIDGLAAYRIALPPFLATGYMVSRDVATHLAFNNGLVVQPSDWPDAILKFESYACDPRIVQQKNRSLLSSNLEAGRRKQGHRRRKSLRRLFYKSYWRRWLTKRLCQKLA